MKITLIRVYIIVPKVKNVEWVIRVGIVVLNATFNNSSAISWRSILLVEETEENRRPTSHTAYRCIENTSPERDSNSQR